MISYKLNQLRPSVSFQELENYRQKHYKKLKTYDYDRQRRHVIKCYRMKVIKVRMKFIAGDIMGNFSERKKLTRDERHVWNKRRGVPYLKRRPWDMLNSYVIRTEQGVKINCRPPPHAPTTIW